MVKNTIELVGGVDILINNAGVGVYGECEAHEVDDFQQVMNVNFFGTLYCIREVLPKMRQMGKGQIINIASVAALHGIPYLSAYCASKSALVAVCQSLRAELSNTQIEIKIIYPGYTNTKFFENEKKVGTVSRPKPHFEPPEKVASQIMKVIEKPIHDKVLSLDGLKLSFLQNFMPGLLEKLLARYALNLSHKFAWQ
jgi:short-subunit dehydrogenase